MSPYTRRPAALTLFAGLLTSLLAGCPAPPDGNGTDQPRPGNSFANAGRLILNDGEVLTLSNRIESGSEVHVFSLGPLSPGDRIVVEVFPVSGSRLDPNTAIFDAAGELFTMNDDFNLSAGRFDSLIDEVIRYGSDPYYLAIAPSFFDPTPGEYQARVRVFRGGAPVGVEGQVVFLNFAGGQATLKDIGSFDLPPFDAARIDSVYDGNTETIINLILETVNENFHGLDITILNSRDHARPTGEFSEVYFGGFNVRAFGISESVDHWNKNKSDRSIVFTDRFDDPFVPQPSVTGIGIAIGNVAAHEIGHLLGLEHTADVTELMDTTGTASTLLLDQDFKKAPLDISVFPFGDQDAWKLLTFLLGLVVL